MDLNAQIAELARALDREDAALVGTLLVREPGLATAIVPAEFGHHQTPLHRAIPGDGEPLTEARTEIVQALLDAGADPNAMGWAPNLGQSVPIARAAWGGHARLVHLLVGYGADPNGMSGQETVPIDTAVGHDHAEAVEALIHAGARHSLWHLLRAGLLDRAREHLTIDPAAASRAVDGGGLPIHAAAAARQGLELVQLLLEAGANVNAQDDLGRTALHVAIENDRGETIAALVERGAEVDVCAAAGLGDAERMAQYLSDARKAQQDGTTALHFAAWSGCLDSARMLLESGSEPSPRSTRFWACLTPLHIAIQRQHSDLVRMLVGCGADLDAHMADRSRYWPTPLHAAARWGTAKDVEYLLASGADPNGGAPVEDCRDTGPLSWAIYGSNENLIHLLLAHGLDLRLPRHANSLRTAAERGDPRIIRLLLENGADVHARAEDGAIALNIARRLGHEDAAAILEAALR